MAVHLNHTIVASHNKKESAEFLCHILGLSAPVPLAHFMTVELDNGVFLDFDDADTIRPQHYAFLVTDDAFDEIFSKVQAAHIPYFADPGHRHPHELNTRDSGRAFYFKDPSGHNLEVLTRPYRSGMNRS